MNHNQTALGANNINVLRHRQAETIASAKAIHAKAAAENRDVTDAENTEFQAILATAEKIKGNIFDLEKLEALERSMPGAPPPSAGRTTVDDNGAKKPWASFGEQLAAVAKYERGGRQSSTADPRLFAALGANEAVESEGGFLVPPDYSATLLKRTYDVALLAGRCNDLPMSSPRLILHAVDENSRVDGSRWGGIQAFWQNEAAAYTATKPKFREMQMVANKLTGLTYVTEELLGDQSALQAYNDQAFPDEFAFKIDDAIMNGVGAGQPLGFMNSGAVVQIAAESGQATGTIVTDNVLKMKARLPVRSRPNAVWLANVDVEPQLSKLTLGSGTAVSLLYDANTQRLANMPVVYIEQAMSLGTSGDLMAVDLQQYLLARKTGGVRMDTSIHVAFLTGEMAFRYMVRLDGQPWWVRPLTPKNGSNVQSPFITLANRP